MASKELSPSEGRKEGTGLTRRTEQQPFLSLQQQMNELFDRFSQGMGLQPWGGEGFFMPSVEVNDTEKELKVTAELPGIDEKDVEVLLDDDALTIRGEKKAESKEQKEGYYRSEVQYGHFERRIPLEGEELDTEHAQAKFDHGVLKISLPKKPEAQTHRKKIPIS